MDTSRPVRSWLAWSPVAAVLWGALAAGGFSIGLGARGCGGLPSPSGPAGPERPDWIPPDPPDPPAPTPNPMGRIFESATWEWRAYPPGSRYEGFEAECTDVDGLTIARRFRRVRP